jgi:hypothetical protein
MGAIEITDTAESLPFNNATNGFAASTTQAAIEEAKATANGLIRRTAFICGYPGNVENEIYLQFFRDTPSGPYNGANVSPLILPETMNLRSISVGRSNTTGNPKINIQNNGTVVASIQFTAGSRTAVVTGLSVLFSQGSSVTVVGTTPSGQQASYPILSLNFEHV